MRSLPVSHGALFDVGGGSMQVSRFRGRRLTSCCQPAPRLAAAQRCLSRVRSPDGRGGAAACASTCAGSCERPECGPSERASELVGTGRHAAKPRQDRPPLAGLPGPAAARLRGGAGAGRRGGRGGRRSRRLEKREAVAGLNDDRGDSIVGGSLAIHTLMEVLEAPRGLGLGPGRAGRARPPV